MGNLLLEQTSLKELDSILVNAEMKNSFNISDNSYNSSYDTCSYDGCKQWDCFVSCDCANCRN